MTNICLIHIGKCGGTSIMSKLKNSKSNSKLNIREYHLNRDYKINEQYIIWIRNPLKRFVSAFYFSYNLINTNTDKLDINNLNLNNCLAPYRIRYKMLNTHRYTFSLRYDYLINYFKTANNLAEIYYK
jgi:hypothetical protein